MSLLYPAAHERTKLSDTALALKIARHSRCAICDGSCSGLRPPAGTVVELDNQEDDSSLGDLTQYGSDDEDKDSRYLQKCACGHGLSDHGADEDVGKDEYARRGRVAIRMDELLSVRGYSSRKRRRPRLMAFHIGAEFEVLTRSSCPYDAS